MTEDLVKFLIPASFVGARLALLPEELSFGYLAGWLDEAAVIKIAEQELALGLKLPSAVEQAALLLSDERTQVPGLLDQIDVEDDARAAEVWIYLSLAWLYEHRRDYQDPLGVIEMVYADFDYPEDIEQLVRYMPAPPGDPIGAGAVEDRWRAYLERKTTEYAHRKWPR